MLAWWTDFIKDRRAEVCSFLNFCSRQKSTVCTYSSRRTPLVGSGKSTLNTMLKALLKGRTVSQSCEWLHVYVHGYMLWETSQDQEQSAFCWFLPCHDSLHLSYKHKHENIQASTFPANTIDIYLILLFNHVMENKTSIFVNYWHRSYHSSTLAFKVDDNYTAGKNAM